MDGQRGRHARAVAGRPVAESLHGTSPPRAHAAIDAARSDGEPRLLRQRRVAGRGSPPVRTADHASVRPAHRTTHRPAVPGEARATARDAPRPTGPFRSRTACHFPGPDQNRSTLRMRFGVGRRSARRDGAAVSALALVVVGLLAPGRHGAASEQVPGCGRRGWAGDRVVRRHLRAPSLRIGV
jgi:hypothetical protein